MSCLRNVIQRSSSLFLVGSASSSSSVLTSSSVFLRNSVPRIKSYATTTSENHSLENPTKTDGIPKTESEVAELLKNAKSAEERKKIFDSLLGTVNIPASTASKFINDNLIGGSGSESIFKPIGRTKLNSGRFGIEIDHSPFESLLHTLEKTSKLLKKFPDGSVYKNSLNSITNQQTVIVKKYIDLIKQNEAKSSEEGVEELIKNAEAELGVEMIEKSLEQVEDEYNLALKMIEFEAWNDLEEKPLPGQWEYFPVPSSTSYPKD